MSAKFVAGPRLAALGLVALMAAPAVMAAHAQDARPPDPPAERALGTGGKPSGAGATAPIGHRQPRAADIPAEVPKDELAQRIERINRALDRQLQICRGC